MKPSRLCHIIQCLLKSFVITAWTAMYRTRLSALVILIDNHLLPALKRSPWRLKPSLPLFPKKIQIQNTPSTNRARSVTVEEEDSAPSYAKRYQALFGLRFTANAMLGQNLVVVRFHHVL